MKDLAAHCAIKQSVMKIKDVPLFQTLDPFVNYLSWVIIVESPQGKSAIDDVFIFAAMDNDIVVESISEEEISVAEDSKIGEILVKEGYLEESEINETLDRHKKIGEELVKDGKITKKVVDSIAQKQQEIRKVQRASTLRIETDKLDRILESIGEVCGGEVANPTDHGEKRLDGSRRGSRIDGALTGISTIFRKM